MNREHTYPHRGKKAGQTRFEKKERIRKDQNDNLTCYLEDVRMCVRT